VEIIETEAKLVLETHKRILGRIRSYNSVRIICNNDADGLVAAHFFYRCLTKLGVGRTRLTLRGYRRPVTPKNSRTLHAYLDLKPSHHWENTVCIDHHGTNEVNPKKCFVNYSTEQTPFTTGLLTYLLLCQLENSPLLRWWVEDQHNIDYLYSSASPKDKEAIMISYACDHLPLLGGFATPHPLIERWEKQLTCEVPPTVSSLILSLDRWVAKEFVVERVPPYPDRVTQRITRFYSLIFTIHNLIGATPPNVCPAILIDPQPRIHVRGILSTYLYALGLKNFVFERKKAGVFVGSFRYPEEELRSFVEKLRLGARVNLGHGQTWATTQPRDGDSLEIGGRPGYMFIRRATYKQLDKLLSSDGVVLPVKIRGDLLNDTILTVSSPHQQLESIRLQYEDHRWTQR